MKILRVLVLTLSFGVNFVTMDTFTAPKGISTSQNTIPATSTTLRDFNEAKLIRNPINSPIKTRRNFGLAANIFNMAMNSGGSSMSSTSHHSSSSSSKSSSTSISISYSSSPSRRSSDGARFNTNRGPKYGSKGVARPFRRSFNFGKPGPYEENQFNTPWRNIGLNQPNRFKTYGFGWPYDRNICKVAPAYSRGPYFSGRRMGSFPMNNRRPTAATPTGNNQKGVNNLYRRALMKLIPSTPINPSLAPYIPTIYRRNFPVEKRLTLRTPITRDLFRSAILLPLVPSFTASGAGNAVVHPFQHLAFIPY